MIDTSETSETVVDLISGYSATRRCKYGTWRGTFKSYPKIRMLVQDSFRNLPPAFLHRLSLWEGVTFFALRTSKEPNGLVSLYSVRRIPS
jgi:hypothetical protein